MFRSAVGIVLTLTLSAIAFANVQNTDAMARIITMNGKPAQCLSAVHIQEIDGERVMVHENGFDIEPGTHSMNGRSILDTTFCRPMRGRISKEIPDLEADFEAGKTYYIGLDHSSRNSEDWRLVIWKVEPDSE